MPLTVIESAHHEGGWRRSRPFLTAEFYAMVAAMVATIVAGESNNSWDDRWVWQVVAAIAVG